MNLEMEMYLKDRLRFMIQRKKSLDVSITEEIVNFLLLAVESYSPAGFAMTKSVTIPWIGNFVRTNMHRHILFDLVFWHR